MKKCMWPTWKTNPLFTAMFFLTSLALIIFLGEKTFQVNREAVHLDQPTPIEHTVSFDGIGKTTMTPDIAEMTFGISSTAASVSDAQKHNTDKMNTLTDKIKSAGIADADLQTKDYSAYEKTSWDSIKQISVSQGWVVSQSLQVKIRDVQKVSDIVQIGGQNGSTSINGPTFVVDDQSKYDTIARAKALADAKQKADSLAQSLGLHINQVVGYSESTDGGTIPPMPYALDAYKTMAGSSAAPAPQIAVGTQDLTMHVNVTYLLSK